MWKMGDFYHQNLFDEHQIIENLQILFLILSTLIFFFLGYKFPKNFELSTLLGSFTLIAIVRELDAYFDDLIPLIGWKFGWIFPSFVFGYIIKYPKQFRRSLSKFFKSFSYNLMMTAIILIIPIAQAIGHKNFIMAILGTYSEISTVRRMIEEAIELEGYILIFFASIEYYFSQIKSKKFI
ncbi:MAG: hypothetical protein MJ250_07815 [Alphaproteobacteria bacterium]|nr:hypothetical protein [Alphaproteobacteria bacterium]